MAKNTVEYKRYAFTVKDNRKDVTDYFSFWDKVAKGNIKVRSKIPEYDSKNRLHYHGVMLIPSNFYRKSLTTFGIHFNLKEIFDDEGWKTYCMKDQYDVDTDTKDLCEELSSVIRSWGDKSIFRKLK